MPKSVLANTLGAAQCVTCVWTAVCGSSSCVLTDEVSQGDTMLAPHGPAHTHLGPWSHGVIQSLVRHHVVRAVRLSRAATQQRRLSDSLCPWTEDAVKNSRRGGRDTARALTHNRHFFSPRHDVVARPPWSGSTGLATCREGRLVLTESLLVCQTGWHHGYFMRLLNGV